MGAKPDEDPFSIPPFLKRDANNRAEFNMVNNVPELIEAPRPAKSKPKSPSKPADKLEPKRAGKAALKAKTAPKATAQAAKGLVKAKAAKPDLDSYGFRKGSDKSEAVMMYVRKSGATLIEVKERIGSVQLNCLITLQAKGYEVIKKKEAREVGKPIYRYWLKAKGR